MHTKGPFMSNQSLSIPENPIDRFFYHATTLATTSIKGLFKAVTTSKVFTRVFWFMINIALILFAIFVFAAIEGQSLQSREATRQKLLNQTVAQHKNYQQKTQSEQYKNYQKKTQSEQFRLPVRNRFGASFDTRIAIQATKECWIEITDNKNNIIFSHVLLPGDIYNVPVTGLKATFGNAGGVDIWKNNRLAHPIGADGERKTIQLTYDVSVYR